MTRCSKLSILTVILATAGSLAFAAELTAARHVTSVTPIADETLAKNAKISMTEARVIAPKAHPGKIVAEELENEKGGSGLRYSFDIKLAKGTQEIGVDAKTGRVLKNKLEGPNPD